MSKVVVNRYVDYATHNKRSRGRRFGGSLGGAFALDVLTPLGKRVWYQGKKMIGRSPDYKGASRKGIYLKYAVQSPADRENILVFRDWLLDQGCEVSLTESIGKRIPRRSFYSVVETYLKLDLR